MHTLQSLGCTKMQGFLFSKPLPAKEMTQVLHNPSLLFQDVPAPPQMLPLL
jgi:EAL domain-containing protein (putative c-di-GMP-specific phosphodiesterase class I)